MGRTLLILLCGMATGHSVCQAQPSHFLGDSSGRGGVIRGTINVVVADSEGIVVLTDSMVTETVRDEHGVVRAVRQLPEPKQKLFQIDDFTVCTFAGFASAETPSVPAFLNDVSAIMGRVVKQLNEHKESRDSPPLKVAEKLELLEVVFGYYIEGIANLRGPMFYSEQDYYFKLLIAGYDPDGTPEVGSLVLKLAHTPGATGEFLSPVTLERNVSSVGAYHEPLLAGITDIANKIQNDPAKWHTDKAVADYEEAKKSGKPPTIEQMSAYAISMKEHTAEAYPEVGGENQIAVLKRGRVLRVAQHPFPSVPAREFRFRILTCFSMTGDMKDRSKAAGFWGVVTPGCFPIYFNNSFTRARQEIGNSYYSGNVFREAVLSYKGGTVQFGTSNQVIDSDLLLGPKVRQDSPEVQQLLERLQGKLAQRPIRGRNPAVLWRRRISGLREHHRPVAIGQVGQVARTMAFTLRSRVARPSSAWAGIFLG